MARDISKNKAVFSKAKTFKAAADSAIVCIKKNSTYLGEPANIKRVMTQAKCQSIYRRLAA